jgi:hypothetical protein
MAFYILLLLVNFLCFVPLYALNFRDAPNPFEFLTRHAIDKKKLKFLYAKHAFSDPFRIDFDYTFVMLLAAAANYEATWLTWCATFLLTFGFVEILHTSVMQSVFKRPPAIVSDISLIKAGLNIAQRHAYWIVAAAIMLLAGSAFAAYAATELLFRLLPQDRLPPLIGALLLLPPCLYHWRKFAYAEFLSRTVYSPTLHLYRSMEYSSRLQSILGMDADHFARQNHFKEIELRDSPNVLLICIESYGSIVYRDAQYSSVIEGLLHEYDAELGNRGYRFASTYSEPPIFAGGSWLSYASFTYGIRMGDLQLFDGLFTHSDAFGAYESVFHVLKRNGYKSFLLCPLGGIDTRSVDWATIDRCFQSDRNLDFESLGYRGKRVNYLGLVRRYSAPDQYSLNFAYDTVRQSCPGPFSLFFCTLNSHFPWDSPTEAVADWRALNDPNALHIWGSKRRATAERYCSAIRYQLDYILRFIVEHADDDLLVVLFGDHQPPILTPERMGKQTPVHVISRNRRLIEVLHNHGFAAALNLTGIEPHAIRHEGFMSLFLKAMHAAYGKQADLEIEYREHGAMLLDEP